MSSPARGSRPARRGERASGARPIMGLCRVRPSRGFRRRDMGIAVGLLGFMLATSAQAGQCVANSGARTVALVELYTSDRCRSCPPADRWLSDLVKRGYVPERVVPLALHVDYGDYI